MFYEHVIIFLQLALCHAENTISYYCRCLCMKWTTNRRECLWVCVCVRALFYRYYIIENNRWNNKNPSSSLALHLYCFLFSAFAFCSFPSLFMKTSTICFNLHDVDAYDFVSSTQFPCMNSKLCQFFVEHAAFLRMHEIGAYVNLKLSECLQIKLLHFRWVLSRFVTFSFSSPTLTSKMCKNKCELVSTHLIMVAFLMWIKSLWQCKHVWSVNSFSLESPLKLPCFILHFHFLVVSEVDLCVMYTPPHQENSETIKSKCHLRPHWMALTESATEI